MKRINCKPKIILLMHYLELGGAEAALIGLLKTLDPNRVDVDLFLNQHTGSYMSKIPPYVNLLPENSQYASIESPIIKAILKSPKIAFYRIIAKLIFIKYIKNGGSVNCATHFMMDKLIGHLPSLYNLGNYDVAISFLDPPHIVQDKILAKRKIEWIHTDFNAIDYDKNLTYSRWAANDRIISISDDITKSFSCVFPSLKNKIYKIENIIPSDEIKGRSGEKPLEYSNISDKVILCTMARLNTPQKNVTSIPAISRILKDRGLKFSWFVLGAGDKTSILNIILENKVESEVVLLGPQENPYPFVKYCDIYVQPSLYEGKSIAVREAQILRRPVIITDYPTSGSQVNDGIDGIICGMSNNEIAESILRLANNPSKRQEIENYLSLHDYGLSDEINKFYYIINE